MKILIFSPIEVIPTNQGAARRIVDMGRTLAELGHKVTIIDVTLASVFRNRKPQVLLRENNIEVITTGFFRQVVFEHLLCSDIVQFEFPFLFVMMIFLKILGKNYVLDEHDVEYFLSKNTQQIEVQQERKSPYFFLNKIFQQTPPIVLAIERISVRLASIVFTCSQIDAYILSQLYKTPKKKIAVIPNCVRACSYEKVKAHPFVRPVVVFLGSFNHLPNIYGAKLLIEEIMPIVRKEIPDVLFVIIGPNPPSWLERSPQENIIVTGEVADVRSLIAGATVAVAPIYHGSGTRLKIIEYMHMGKPIVSTTKGAEGLDVENGVNILLRDNLSDFADAIVKLIKDPEKAREISKNCLELARQKYSWETSIRLVNSLYESLLET